MYSSLSVSVGQLDGTGRLENERLAIQARRPRFLPSCSPSGTQRLHPIPDHAADPGPLSRLVAPTLRDDFSESECRDSLRLSGASLDYSSSGVSSSLPLTLHIDHNNPRINSRLHCPASAVEGWALCRPAICTSWTPEIFSRPSIQRGASRSTQPTTHDTRH